MKVLKALDDALNGITMYRLLVYGLAALLAVALLLGGTNVLPISPAGIVASVLVLVAVCYVANRSLAIVWEATNNSESWLITALILCIILPPSTEVHQLALIGLAGLIAMVSKYLIVRHRKHLFNPAAFAAIVLGLTSLLPATWWIGSPAMLPFAVILGVLILRKIRRFQLFGGFLVGSIFVAVLVGAMHSQTLGYTLTTHFKSSPLIFLGTVMLTEPETSPPRLWQQRIYGLIVGALFASQLRFGIASATPEIALVLGNLYSYAVSPRYKLLLHFKSKTQLAPNIYDFGFESDVPLSFMAGQYMEWTLAGVTPDRRGNRRTFSIASAPDEEEIHIAIRTFEHGSNFKKALAVLDPGDSIIAGHLAGDFVMPKDTAKKLSFIAGGIGITPFVSMAKYMVKEQEKRDIVLFYLVGNAADFCYKEVWQAAHPYGLRVVPILGATTSSSGWRGRTGRLSEAVIREEIPDYATRRFYISGPNGLVESYNDLLSAMGIGQREVITDHFSGY